MVQTYSTWWQKPNDGEQGMEEEHYDQWQEFLNTIQGKDLTGASLLDFGCNQGGLLRRLYEQRPFKKAVGIDLAADSIAIANQRAREKNLPIDYLNTGKVDGLENSIDIAISTDVMYLIDDLKEHAQQISTALKDNGVYYARHYDYVSDPEASHLQRKINEFAAKPMEKMHSLHDIAFAFENEGFQVSAIRITPNRFIDITPSTSWHKDVTNYIEGQFDRVYILRFQKGLGFPQAGNA